MKLLISHRSALRYWRANARARMESTTHDCRIQSVRGAVASPKDVRALAPADHGFIMSEDYPLEVLVSTKGGRRYGSKVKPHMWSGEVPSGAFRRVADDIYVSTPELLYLQLAKELDEIELARLALELCGTYRLSHNERFLEDCPALTTVTKLASFITRAGSTRGCGKARSALRWVANNSASPQETNMVLALCLPKRMGGYGLPIPELNPSLPVGSRMREYVEGSSYSPDCLWKRKVGSEWIRITAEYDSREYHDAEQDAERTRIRRNAFKTMGYLVTSVNRTQMRSADMFQYPARQIARDLGLRRPQPSISEISRSDELLQRLRNETVF